MDGRVANRFCAQPIQRTVIFMIALHPHVPMRLRMLKKGNASTGHHRFENVVERSFRPYEASTATCFFSNDQTGRSGLRFGTLAEARIHMSYTTLEQEIDH
jgi:hypothetical protein